MGGLEVWRLDAQPQSLPPIMSRGLLRSVPQVERELRDVIREFEYTIIMSDGSASRASCSNVQRGKESEF